MITFFESETVMNFAFLISTSFESSKHSGVMLLSLSVVCTSKNLSIMNSSRNILLRIFAEMMHISFGDLVDVIAQKSSNSIAFQKSIHLIFSCMEVFQVPLNGLTFMYLASLHNSTSNFLISSSGYVNGG